MFTNRISGRRNATYDNIDWACGRQWNASRPESGEENEWDEFEDDMVWKDDMMSNRENVVMWSNLPSSEFDVATSVPNNTLTAEWGREGTRGGSRILEEDIFIAFENKMEPTKTLFVCCYAVFFWQSEVGVGGKVLSREVSRGALKVFNRQGA